MWPWRLLVNFANFKNVKLYTRSFSIFIFAILLVISFVQGANAWDVDFSRRELDLQKMKEVNRLPASTKEDSSWIEKTLAVAEPSQDIVILNTEKGFVPSNLKLKQGSSYKIHVVNVNEDQKNVSFVLDAFSEHHNTVFGKEKAFTITPKQSGPFSFQCPETGQQGQIFIYSERKPASE